MSRNRTITAVLLAASLLLIAGAIAAKDSLARPHPLGPMALTVESTPAAPLDRSIFDAHDFKARMLRLGLPVEDVKVMTDNPLQVSVSYSKASLFDLEMAERAVVYALRAEALHGVHVSFEMTAGTPFHEEDYITTVSPKVLNDKSAESMIRKIMGIDSDLGKQFVEVQVRTLEFQSGSKQFVRISMSDTPETRQFLESLTGQKGADYLPWTDYFEQLAGINSAPDVDVMVVAFTYDKHNGDEPLLTFSDFAGSLFSTNDPRLIHPPHAPLPTPPSMQSPLPTPS